MILCHLIHTTPTLGMHSTNHVAIQTNLIKSGASERNERMFRANNMIQLRVYI